MQYLSKPIKAKNCSLKDRHKFQLDQALLAAVNHFRTLPKDPIEKYKNLISKTLQQCNKIIDKHKMQYLIQKKPSPPPLETTKTTQTLHSN